MKTTNALELANQLFEAKKQREIVRSDYECYCVLPQLENLATLLLARSFELSEDIVRLERQLSEMEAV